MVCKEITLGHKKVLFFGSKHSSHKEELDLINKTLEKFNPEIILVEGDFDKPDFYNVEESIRRGQEMGFVAFFAKENKIQLESNDPSMKNQKKLITENYGEKIQELYFLLRDTFQRDDKRIKELFEEVFSQGYEVGKDYFDFFNPTLSINKFNDITRKLNVFRDSYMFKRINELLKKYSRIFVIKGDYHIKNNLVKLEELIHQKK